MTVNCKEEAQATVISLPKGNVIGAEVGRGGGEVKDKRDISCRFCRQGNKWEARKR